MNNGILTSDAEDKHCQKMLGKISEKVKDIRHMASDDEQGQCL
jgi:hypothetical protein